ncbi:acid--CoA ligase [Nocardioides flavus (ex Wang et al. 2016)]|uniref:Acid--CoA ligase n=1 Tax=Nocardioides flavus (ex Wang et al. 2016) TaxID=2058780 RepID=A0ABQ3HLD0_9ACTN|nr:long-chain fatty acid--CoA ligase [Nocardioides flavus (ex Wang et al. 2016)]GHE17718.1 acid--CoA ligase [Nocardioides flavus (ex Wang et al. 2016)]
MQLPDLTAKRASLHPDRVALVDPDRDRSVTYGELESRAGRLARLLQDEWSVRAGDRVATLAHNRVEAVELLFACAKLGAVLVPLNWRLAPAELEFILVDADVVALAHDAAHAEVAHALTRNVPGARGGIRLLDLDDGFEARLADADPAPLVHEPRGEDALWYLLYTSGTTGKPKGVEQTAGMALVNHLNIGMAAGITSDDVFLSVLPQFHTGGWNLYVLPMLFVGGTAVIPSGFDPAQTLRLLQDRVTVFFGVPTIYQMLVEHPDFAGADLSGVRSWSAGGAAMPVPLLERLDAAGVQVRQGMGMTETGPTVFLLDEEHAISKAGSVGKPQPFVDVRLVDTEGRDVAPGESGELWFRGPGITPGYWRNDAATEAAFVGGWLRSGDVGRQDEDGFYYVVDRVKDMYISGGENVYPAEVEAVLLRLPGVRSAAVIGVPDERWGEVGRALVEVEPGVRLDGEDVRRHCRAHLAGYKVPAAVEVVHELPRGATGKVLKHVLRAERVGS